MGSGYLKVPDTCLYHCCSAAKSITRGYNIKDMPSLAERMAGGKTFFSIYEDNIGGTC